MLRVETMVKLTLQDLKMFRGPYEERLSVIHSFVFLDRCAKPLLLLIQSKVAIVIRGTYL